jgi:hypothetical protein
MRKSETQLHIAQTVRERAEDKVKLTTNYLTAVCANPRIFTAVRVSQTRKLHSSMILAYSFQS